MQLYNFITECFFLSGRTQSPSGEGPLLAPGEMHGLLVFTILPSISLLADMSRILVVDV